MAARNDKCRKSVAEIISRFRQFRLFDSPPPDCLVQFACENDFGSGAVCVTRRRAGRVRLGTADRTFGAASLRAFVRDIISQPRRSGRRGPKGSSPCPERRTPQSGNGARMEPRATSVEAARLSRDCGAVGASRPTDACASVRELTPFWLAWKAAVWHNCIAF